jgi:hypothetical protein
MRIAGRILMGVLVLAVLLTAGPPVWRASRAFYDTVQKPSLVASDAQASTSYVIATDRPLEFRLSGHADLVRLRTHALLPAAGEQRAAPTAGYALDIELLDSDGNLLHRESQHIRSIVGRYLDAATGEPFAVNLVDDSNFSVAGVNLIPLSLADWPAAEVVRVRLAGADAQISEVGIRVYEPEAIPEHSIERFWQRLSDRQRSRLAEGNVYPQNLMTGEERAAVLSRRWRPVGPSGVEDRDYRVRSLFTREDRPGAFIAYAIPVLETRLEPGRPVDLPVTETGRYSLRANLATVQPGFDAEPAQLRVDIFSSQANKSFVIAVPGPLVARDLVLGPGGIRLSSDKPVRLTLLRSPAPPGAAASAVGFETRAFRLRAGGGLTYELGGGQAPSVLRLDLWRRLDGDQGNSSGAFAVTYEFKDAASTVIGSGSFATVASAPAPDLLSDDTQALLSSTQQEFLDIPSGVVAVTFSAPQEIHLAAFTRLPPAADDPAAADLFAAEWFGMAPAGWSPLIAGGGTLLIEQSSGRFVRSGPVDAQ